MNKEELNLVITNKVGRQGVLNERKKELESLDIELSVSKFSRSFRTFYYFLKRLILIPLSIVLLVGALLLFFSPQEALDATNIKDELVDSYKASYVELVGKTFKESVYGLLMSNDRLDAENFVKELDMSIEKTAEEDIIYTIKFFAVGIILLGVTLLYVSRLTRKLKKRNSLISKADTITQDIIKYYKVTIEEEDKELEALIALRNNMDQKTTETANL